MPGLLRPDAACPLCKRQLAALVDTTHGYENGKPPKIAVTREYFHVPRRRRCIATFEDLQKAVQERYELEVHA